MSQPTEYTIAVEGEVPIHLLKEEVEFVANAVYGHLGEDGITTVSNSKVTVSVK
uniref:Uncharacterized protein n=1 Tax=viral metagenome TaxID=1070528 RepID=A0A6M3LAM1_9ZZZZ